jgi:methyl-accepting chemotaxis protein
VLLRKSMKAKLILSLLLLTLIPLMITMGLASYFSNQSMDQLIEQDTERTISTLDTYLVTKTEALQKLAVSYAAQESVSQSMLRKDRATATQAMAGIFNRLKAEQQLAVMELEDEQGKVFLRAHDPAKFGDDKSQSKPIQAALQGKASSGFEFGSSGIALRAFAPVQSGGKTIGILQLGLNDSFLGELQKLLGLDLVLFDQQGKLVKSISGDSTNASDLSSRKDITEHVAAGNTFYEETNNKVYIYRAMMDPTNTQLIGFIQITRDISVKEKLKADAGITQLTFTGITAIIVLVAAWWLAVSTTNPIIALQRVTASIAAGNLQASYTGKRREDELGSLAEGLNHMIAQLRQVISEVTDATGTVDRSALELMQQAGQLSNTSEEVAAAMSSAAEGVEQQAYDIQKALQLLNELAAMMERIAEGSREGASFANQASQHAMTGNIIVQQSLAQMQLIQEKTGTTSRTIHSLEEKSKWIAEVTSTISAIARQTNILALNAGIEAVRAGEHGKGFSVVAVEIRKLAEESSTAAERITDSIAEIIAETERTVQSMSETGEAVEQGLYLAQEAGSAFTSITHDVSRVDATMLQLAGIIEQVHTSLLQLVEASNQLDHAAQTTTGHIQTVAATAEEQSAATEEMSASSISLSDISQRLLQAVKQFKL